MNIKVGKLLTVTALATRIMLGSFVDSAEAAGLLGTWGGSSNGIFLELERDYQLLNAISNINPTPTDIQGTKIFGRFLQFPQVDTLFLNNLELDLDVLARTELGNIGSLTPDLAQEVTQLQSQGAIYGQDYFLFDDAALAFNSSLSLGGTDFPETTFVTPNSNSPSDFGSNNFFTTQGQNVVDTENLDTFEIESSISTSISLETATILVSKLKLDDELIIGQQDDVNVPGAFYRTFELPDFCGSFCDDLGFNKNNGVSFPIINSLSGQFNPEYVTETNDKLLFKYRILIDLGVDAERYFLFVPAFTAPDANGNFNELNPSFPPSVFDFLSFPDNKSGGCADFGSPENAICLGGVLDLGSNNIENKITEQFDLLDDLTTANAGNPNVILEDTQVLKYRRTELIREAADSNNEGIFNLRPYGVFSPPVELVITEKEEVSVPEPNATVTLLSLGFFGMGMILNNKKRK
ncbi:MAG: hypothetical protein QNJ65_16640 [Xenococcaceae cyanobacterium MO_234.B1]|nr:hypothetical protein [Xenococcaceae cyanobacterium MO_234.B1]